MKVLFSLILFANISQAAEVSWLKKETVNEISKEDLPLLKKVPPVSVEEMMWFLPGNLWRASARYIQKGRMFRFEFKEGKSIDFYIDKNKTKKSPFKILHLQLLSHGKEKCSGDNNFSYKEKTIKQCGMLNCIEVSGFPGYGVRLLRLVSLFKSENISKEISYDDWDKVRCPYLAGLTINGGATEDSLFYHIPIIDVDPKTKMVSVMLDGEEHFMDASFCNPKNCSEREIKYSDYEFMYVMNIKRQIEKKNPEMDYFIKELLPCVKKKDKECVMKFFITEKDVMGVGYEDGFKIGYQKSITDDDLIELEACLNYESLLPFDLSYRGKKRACILAPMEWSHQLRKKFLKIGEQALVLKLSEADNIYNEFSFGVWMEVK